MVARNRAKRQGLTMLEVLIVITILAVMTSILTPVFQKANRSARVVSTLSRLKQVHMAVMLYQIDTGKSAEYGPKDAMGLPSRTELNRWIHDPGASYKYPIEMFLSACGAHPSDTTGGFTYWPGGDTAHAQWAKLVTLYQDNMILFHDLNCTDPDVDIYNRYDAKRGLGVLLSGQLVNFVKVGDCKSIDFWTSPTGL